MTPMTAREIDALVFGRKACEECGKQKVANSDHFGYDERTADHLSDVCLVCQAKREPN